MYIHIYMYIEGINICTYSVSIIHMIVCERRILFTALLYPGFFSGYYTSHLLFLWPSGHCNWSFIEFGMYNSCAACTHTYACVCSFFIFKLNYKMLMFHRKYKSLVAWQDHHHHHYYHQQHHKLMGKCTDGRTDIQFTFHTQKM